MKIVNKIVIPIILLTLFSYNSKADISIDSLEYVVEGLRGNRKAEVLNILAKQYFHFDIDKSRDYGQKALILAKEISNRKQEALAYELLGRIFLAEKKDDKALKNFGLALAIAKRINDEKEMAINWTNTGDSYVLRKWDTEALACYQEAESMFKKIGIENSALLNSYGEIYVRFKNHEKALTYFKKGLKQAKSDKDKYYIKKIAANMSNSYSYLGDYKKADEFNSLSNETSLNINDGLKFKKSSLTDKEESYENKETEPTLKDNRTKKKETPRSLRSYKKSTEQTDDKSNPSMLYVIIVVLSIFIIVLGYFGYWIKNRYHSYEDNLTKKHNTDTKKLRDTNFLLRNEIKKRHKIEETIIQEKAFLSSLLDSIPDLISYKDNAGTYLGCNKSYSIFSGKSVDELKGKTDYNLFPREKANIYKEKENQILSTGRPWRNKDWERNSYGQRLLLDMLKTPFYSPDGEILGIISISRDMTAMKQAEDKIIKLSHAVEQSPVSIVITDMSGNVDYVNPNFEKMTGYSPEEMIGKNLRILKSGKVTSSTYKNLWDTITKGKTWSGELYNKKKDNSLYWDYTVISPIVDESGDIVNFVATKEDISIKKKQAEELLKAKVSAENANLIKSRFLSKMSHEIRTPMNGVVASVDFLQQTEQTEEQMEYTEIIKNSSNELILKLNAIFDFSDMEDNKIVLDKAPFNITKSINEVVTSFEKEVNEKGLQIHANIDKNLPESVIGDKLRFAQIIGNLTSNAVKFTKKGEILISAKLDEISDNIAKVKIKVKDTGIGISKVIMDKLFKAYVGGDDTDERHHDGMGLGLVLTKELITLMRGNVEVESEENRGSTFTFTAEFEIDTNVSPILDQAKLDCDNLRVLIVDPRENTRNLIASSLKEWGCFATEAGSAEEGFKILNSVAGLTNRMYDIAIVDSVLPDADGMIFARTIRSNKYIRDTKLILINSSVTISERDFKLAGYFALLDKPIDFEILKKQLSKIKLLKKTTTPVFISESSAIVSKDNNIKNEEKKSSNVHVLLVDDNRINLKVGGMALKKMQYTYDEAINGKISVEKFKETKYDLILMDIQMPEMDGLEATRLIREIERKEGRRRIPIIALTAKATDGKDDIYFKAGMDELISKPFRPKDLKERLKKYELSV